MYIFLIVYDNSVLPVYIYIPDCVVMAVLRVGCQVIFGVIKIIVAGGRSFIRAVEYERAEADFYFYARCLWFRN